jgi:hypothetical protein
MAIESMDEAFAETDPDGVIGALQRRGQTGLFFSTEVMWPVAPAPQPRFALDDVLPTTTESGEPSEV